MDLPLLKNDITRFFNQSQNLEYIAVNTTLEHVCAPQNLPLGMVPGINI